MNRFLLVLLLTPLIRGLAQPPLTWTELASLPGNKGWAGLYAGVSHGALIALGGANFPDRPPWEGGTKKWYDDAYVLVEGAHWRKFPHLLPEPSAYGVTVSHRNRLILIGGSTASRHLDRVVGYEWDGNRLLCSAYPSLPVSLANMTGTMVGEVVVVAGGSRHPGGPAQRTCYALDLGNPSAGWVELPAWPGPERQFPVCAVYGDHFYLFSGETVGKTATGKPFRRILQDGYRMRLTRKTGEWSASWEPLAPMPRGAAAAGTELPVLGDRILIWGGVDAITAVHKNPATHPGISPHVLVYFPETDGWEFLGQQTRLAARVTLPVVFWQGRWVYLSGEIKPGVRTPSVVGVR